MLSPDYGGAELRFFDIFTELTKTNDDVFLIIPECLKQKFSRDFSQRRRAIDKIVPIDTEDWGRWKLIRAFMKLLKTLPPGSTFHYPFNYLWPLHIIRNDNVLISLVDCHTSPTFFSFIKNNPWFLLSCIFTKKIDILRPSTFQWLKSQNSKKELSLTPRGTFQLKKPKITKYNKKLKIIYFSRLEIEKGISEWIQIIPTVDNILQSKYKTEAHFLISGYGSLEDHVEKSTQDLIKKGVNVNFIGKTNADNVFKEFGVFLSIQKFDNYPSRIVAEALTRGCPVIISRIGDSENFPDIKYGINYVSPNLNPEEISKQLYELQKKFNSFSNLSKTISKQSIKEFSHKDTIDYYRDFFDLKT